MIKKYTKGDKNKVVARIEQVSEITLYIPSSVRCMEYLYDGLMVLCNNYAVDDSSGWELPPHISVVDGSDVRQRLPDILNTPIKYYYYESYDRKKRVSRYHRAVRKGRWYETFDKWFRTYGEQLFLKLCRERGLI